MKLSDNKPVFLQIKAWIEDHILRGEWRAGEQLPSVRELSVRFGVNANTVVRTYERLLFDGSVRSVRGVGLSSRWNFWVSVCRRWRGPMKRN